MTTVYGISNCDTVKKARKWLDEAGVTYRFHDFRTDGLSREQVSQWLDELGWAVLVNQRSTSWRELDAQVREQISDGATAVAAILDQPTLIKRPLLDTGNARHVGFSAASYAQIFGQR